MLVNPTAFRFPVMYTPGDNEWTDCQKPNGVPKPGTPDPIQNLVLVRTIFFANPGHTIAVDKPVLAQPGISIPRIQPTRSSSRTSSGNNRAWCSSP